jgi:hypothetical protein
MKHIETFENFKVEDTVTEGLAYSNSQIQDAVTAAEEAFWTSVASSFPDVKTGDFSPSDTIKLLNAMKAAVTTWLKENA